MVEIQDLRRRFVAATAAGDDGGIAPGALVIARIGHPDLAPEPTLAALDALADEIRPRIVVSDPPERRAAVLAHHLFDERGFRGNTDDYYDPRNSFLQHVLTRRVGIPISLSVVYLEVARRLDVPAEGVGFPGHFLVRVDEPGAPMLVLDPFHAGAELDQDALVALHRKISGADAPMSPSLLAPLPKRKILARMLHNLAGIFGARGDWFASLEVLERLALVEGDNERLARDLVSLRARVASLN